MEISKQFSLSKKFLKIQFHLHTGLDPHDAIKHTEKELIDATAKLQYDVIAITCHNTLVFNEELFQYAAKKNILLIPGIEKTIAAHHGVV